MRRFRSTLIVALGVAALAIPAGAVANHGESHGKAKGHANGKANNGKAKGKGQAKGVGYVFKGFYAGDGKVDVKRGNAHVRKAGFFNETVEFDFSNARIVVADTNGDGNRTIDDVSVGDWVLVKTRLPRKDPGQQPFDAKHLINKTAHPSTED